MDLVQIILNAAFGLLVLIGGFLFNALWGILRDLQRADSELAKRVAEIDTLVAGQYVKREEFRDAIDKLAGKIDKLNDNLITKIDSIHGYLVPNNHKRNGDD